MAQGTLFGRIMLALVRIAVGWIFFFFGQYKILGTKFVHEGFAQSVRGWISEGQPAHWVLPVLNHYVLAHPQAWARVIAWSEMLIAVSLILGLWIRISSLGGILFMLTVMLSTWYAAGYPAATWQFIAAHLAQIPLMLLFILFFAMRAGETLGLDGFLPSTKK
jgi:thiosulfate dehydrogenase (quinone) large subunit